MEAQSELITVAETQNILGGVSRSFVEKLLAKKKLPRVKLSYKVMRIPRAAVEEYIRLRTTGAASH